MTTVENREGAGFRIERVDHHWVAHMWAYVMPLREGAKAAGVNVVLGRPDEFLTWLAYHEHHDAALAPQWPVGIAQAWRVGKTHPCDPPKKGGAWRMSGLFVQHVERRQGVGFALQKARFEYLRDVLDADSIDSFAFKPAPFVALGFSPVREFKMGTTRVLWKRKG